MSKVREVQVTYDDPFRLGDILANVQAPIQLYFEVEPGMVKHFVGTCLVWLFSVLGRL